MSRFLILACLAIMGFVACGPGSTVYVNRYPFVAGRHYRLTYTIYDFARIFADCHAVRIRFALRNAR